MPLVTVATCTYVFEAEVLRGLLASEGIAAGLWDAEVVTADWAMSVAVGGVKVRVDPADAERAATVLTDPADPFEDDEPHSHAEVASWRALTAALLAAYYLGTLFAVYYVVRVVATADGESGRTWRRAMWAALFVLLSLAPFLAFWAAGLLE